MVVVNVLERSPPPERWGSSRTWGDYPEYGDYAARMPAAKPDPDLVKRQRAFSLVVARVVDTAKARGMTVREMEEATGLGSTTWYGWIEGRWKRDPAPSKVNAFMDGLGAARETAYEALRWDTAPKPRRSASATPPIVEDPLLRQLMRKLNSPKTPVAQKLMIRRTIAALIGEEEEPPNTRE